MIPHVLDIRLYETGCFPRCAIDTSGKNSSRKESSP
jgi:hypothetical protein